MCNKKAFLALEAAQLHSHYYTSGMRNWKLTYIQRRQNCLKMWPSLGMVQPFSVLHIEQTAHAPWATDQIGTYLASVLGWKDFACWSSSRLPRQKVPLWVSQCFLQRQRAGAETSSSSAGPSCSGNGSLKAEMGTDSQHLPANMWEHHQQNVSFFFLTGSLCTSIPINKGIEDWDVALQALSQLVTHALRRVELF